MRPLDEAPDINAPIYQLRCKLLEGLHNVRSATSFTIRKFCTEGPELKHGNVFLEMLMVEVGELTISTHMIGSARVGQAKVGVWHDLMPSRVSGPEN